MALADELIELAAQPRIAEHLQVGFEDRAVFLAELGGNGVAIALDLQGRGVDCLAQAFQLAVDGVAR